MSDEKKKAKMHPWFKEKQMTSPGISSGFKSRRVHLYFLF